MRHTRGTDPEFFMVDRKTGKVISAIPYIEGIKDEPVKLPCGGTAIRDNVALEFATVPVDSEDAFVDSIQKCIHEVRKLVPKKFSIQAMPSAIFDKDQLDNPEAMLFGCDPDYDAWELKMNKPPCAFDLTLRTCGGHIHVGHVEGDGNDFLLTPYGRVNTIKVMDAVHGVISAILDNSPEALRRKELYGKAGCHRPTTYGIEYRSLSNFWLKSPKLVRLMDSLTKDVLQILRKEKDPTSEEECSLINEIGANRIQTIINTNDVTDARKVFEVNLRPVLSQKSIDLFKECEKEIDSYDFEKEWGIM